MVFYCNSRQSSRQYPRFIGNIYASSTCSYVSSCNPSRLVLIPNYAHYWCYHSGLPLINVTRALLATSRQISPSTIDQPSRRRPMPIDRTMPIIDVSLIDRWSAHPVLADVSVYIYSIHKYFVQMWSKTIRSQVESMSSDAQKRIAIVFCAPKVVCMYVSRF